MKLTDKTCSMASAIARIKDGDVVMVGGFGVPGTPMQLIQALVAHGARDLTIIKNDANEPGMGIDRLLQNGQVSRLITTHLGLNAGAISLMNDGKIDVEFNAQGILAERIRAGGAGIGAILSDVGVDTEIAFGKQSIVLDGKKHLVETALRADVSLIHAASADPFGNLIYAATARNFNPLMAMAADCVIVEAEAVLPLGALAPDAIHTPGVFVDHLVELESLTEEYAVVRR